MRTILIFIVFILLYSCSNDSFIDSPSIPDEPYSSGIENRATLDSLQTLISGEVYSLTKMTYSLPEDFELVSISELNLMNHSELMLYVDSIGIDTILYVSTMQNLNTYSLELNNSDKFKEASMDGAITAFKENYEIIGIQNEGDVLETRATPCYDLWHAAMVAASVGLTAGFAATLWTANPLPILGSGIVYLAASYHADAVYKACMHDRYPNWGG